MVTYSISRADFDFIRDFVNARSAIVLDDGKEYLVESRLLQVIRKKGMGSMEELIIKLRLGRDVELQDSVIDAMTTNETSWFRDVHPFEVLREKVLPEIFAKNDPQKELKIWCAACSSGQEPYTIAMLLKEKFPTYCDWNIQILGCDLSSEMIQRAKAGLYSKLELNRGLPALLMVKYFEQEGRNARIKKNIRDMIEYRSMNLVKAWPYLPRMDVVFLRNVMIYFAPEIKREILRKVRTLLKPGGYLFLGAAETTINLDDSFEIMRLNRTTCYRAPD